MVKEAQKRIQGHAKFSMREQAEKFINARANRGKSKASGAILRSDRTVQRYQGDLGRAAEVIQKLYGVHKLKDITQQQAQNYINARLQENIRVRTVQGYAKALQMLPLVSQLHVPARNTDKQDKPMQARAYTREQIHAMQQHIALTNAKLATQIMLESGCRTKDLASLCLERERPARNARLDKLHADRFLGREDWIRVTFIGKGGHEYTSTISPKTARELEKMRLLIPRDFRERNQPNIVTRQYYNLPAGLRLSKLWSDASKCIFLQPRGLHGVRHTFAQERLREMLQAGMTWDKALQCVSQQMGHYRASEVGTYCR
jgi:integrase